MFMRVAIGAHMTPDAHMAALVDSGRETCAQLPLCDCEIGDVCVTMNVAVTAGITR